MVPQAAEAGGYGGLHPASTLKGVIDTMVSLGLERPRLLRAAELDAGTLDHPQGSVDPRQVAAVWSAARTQSGLSALPTRVGLRLPFGSFGLVDYMVASAEAVLPGLETLVARFSGVAGLFTFEVDLAASTVRVVGEPVVREDGVEFALAVMVNRLRDLTSGHVRFQRMELNRGLEKGRPQEELLNMSVTYGAPQGAVVLEPASFRLPSRAPDPGLYRTLEDLADRLGIGPAGPHFESSVRACIRQRLAQGCDADSVARALGISERSLSRRLAAGGRRFRDLLDEVRARESERQLLMGQPVSAVALQVGYAEQSAFARAFKRWNGLSPRAWLEQRSLTT